MDLIFPSRALAQEVNRDHWLHSMRQEWKPGQHISLWGKTGCGKTTVCAGLMALRQWSVVLATKQEDVSIGLFQGYKTVARWKERNWYQHHVIVWPYARTLGEAKTIKRQASKELLEAIYIERGWTLLIDDAKYVRSLGLEEDMRTMITQCRSQGTSIVINDQRPFRSVQEFLDQVDYSIMFYMKDRRDVWRMAEANGESPDRLLSLNSQLHQYDFLFLPTLGEPVIVRH